MASAGVTYRIAVDGANGETGYFELGWGIGPSNDDFAAANELRGDSGAVTGDNRYATLEPGEPEHGPYGSASVWYRWTAPLERAGHVRALRQLLRHDARRLHRLERRWADARDAGLQRLSGGYGARVSFPASVGQEYRDRGGRRLRGARRHRASLEPRRSSLR